MNKPPIDDLEPGAWNYMTKIPHALTAQRLILGGHSFIRQLGTDPYPDEATQVRLVEDCLNAGITWFDTTYQPERVALGHALRVLDRRPEARLIAWNFFHSFPADSMENVGGPEPWESHRLSQILDELQTNHLDSMVLHAVPHLPHDLAQERLAGEWKNQGHIAQIGMWGWRPDILARQPSANFYDFIVHPRNITNAHDADANIQAAHLAGLATFACSPFVRGWELETLLEKAVEQGLDDLTARDRIASLMLRFSLFAPGVDKLIVAMRQPAWIARNISAVSQGPLSTHEQIWLTSLIGEKTKPEK